MVTSCLLLSDSCDYPNNSGAVKNRVCNSGVDEHTSDKSTDKCVIDTHQRNMSDGEMRNKTNLTSLRVPMMALLSLLAMASALAGAEGAAVYSNINFLTNPKFEQICSVQQEHYIESDGKESSLILEFAPGVLAEKRHLCTRILSAPANYGFIVRLILPKIRRNRHGATAKANTHDVVGPATGSGGTSGTVTAAATASAEADGTDASSGTSGSGMPALSGMTSLIDKINASVSKSAKQTRSCPLSIFSSLDFHTPQWRLDPCQLEDTAPEMDDPVRLFHGRVRIVWEHGHHKLHSKLMVTALGKGEQCRSEKKHQCLRIGDEPILCISKDLVCDGIRHCPVSNEYDSDEDYDMCWKRRRYGEPIPPAMETDIFEHFALEVFRNLFAFDVPTRGETTTTATVAADAASTNEGVAGSANSTTLRKVDSKQTGQSGSNDTSKGASNATTTTAQVDTNTTESSGGHHRRNSTRSGLNSDLSKYGPWGYLMLGMLLCGGALLICGLWVCCCRLSFHIQTIRSLSASASQHATQNERESALQSSAAAAAGDLQTGSASPPNYEELDPPPAYSVLFPNQKAASSTTLSSLGAAALMPPTIAAVAVTTPNGTVMTMSAGGDGAAAPSAATATTTSAAASVSPAASSTTTCVQLESATCSSQAH
ncbi:uncharacterized protein LOC120770905 isoform X1 [Bactrocera tryoni]|uniref:uncharacterized protein LOC120770905 isoform X1 n=1 Tax=Bactrocera tryoni TaxID=59916 RepID=UPI001A962B2C|nr:uncharacterized protein LOC120770905 isoform X1 [Bactrocera tryoni]